MCGIAGFIGKNKVSEDQIRKTLALMENRGPDHQSFHLFTSGSLHGGLLASRLSIIDRRPQANQPFRIGSHIVVFNGEIYNYVELRDRLRKQGVAFTTNSDTEVLLQSYLIYGQSCVQSFEGMWSFAIYDGVRHQLFLSRDRFGEKPLYLTRDNGRIVFASEIKFLKTLIETPLSINDRQILRFLVNGYKSLYKTGETFFTKVEEFAPGANMIIDGTLEARTTRYWIPSSTIRNMSEAEAIEGFRDRLHESIRIRLRADVPVAACLSGGVDSSAIVSIAAKTFGYGIHTFSIVDADARYSEIENIRATVEDVGCDHTILEIPKSNFWERLRGLVAYHDAPVYTISYYIHSFLSEAISRAGYRVALSGTGADELVTGYYDHFNLHLYEMRSHPQYEHRLQEWRDHIRPLVRNPHLQNPDLYLDDVSHRDHIYLNSAVVRTYLKRDFIEDFSEKRFCGSLLRNRMMNEMFEEIVPVILHEDDLNSMLYSIENRSPYLDSRLFEYSCSIPNEHLIKDGYAKYILRSAVRGVLNEQVRTDRCKKGFNASILSLVDFQQPENRDSMLADGPIFDYIRRDAVASLMDASFLQNSMSKFLFNCASVRCFLDLNA